MRVHTPLSIPSASVNDSKLFDMMHQWAPKLSGRGTGSDTNRNEGIRVDVANAHAAAIHPD